MKLNAIAGLVGMVLSLAMPAKALRVCADANYLPFSNQAGGGFENKIAVAVAKALGELLNTPGQATAGTEGFRSFFHPRWTRRSVMW